MSSTAVARNSANTCVGDQRVAARTDQLGKILLGSGGTQTGVWGVSAVRGGVEGFGNASLELTNLPVEGSFLVTRGGLGSLAHLL